MVPGYLKGAVNLTQQLWHKEDSTDATELRRYFISLSSPSEGKSMLLEQELQVCSQLTLSALDSLIYTEKALVIFQFML